MNIKLQNNYMGENLTPGPSGIRQPMSGGGTLRQMLNSTVGQPIHLQLQNTPNKLSEHKVSHTMVGHTTHKVSQQRGSMKMMSPSKRASLPISQALRLEGHQVQSTQASMAELPNF